MSEHFLKNLQNSISLPALWRLEYSFLSQLNEMQLFFAKYLAHIFVQGLIISGEQRAFEDMWVPKLL